MDEIPIFEGSNMSELFSDQPRETIAEFLGDVRVADFIRVINHIEPDPRCSMYGIFTYIYPKNGPNVGKYSIHGASGDGNLRHVKTNVFTLAR